MLSVSQLLEIIYPLQLYRNLALPMLIRCTRNEKRKTMDTQISAETMQCSTENKVVILCSQSMSVAALWSWKGQWLLPKILAGQTNLRKPKKIMHGSFLPFWRHLVYRILIFKAWYWFKWYYPVFYCFYCITTILCTIHWLAGANNYQDKTITHYMKIIAIYDTLWSCTGRKYLFSRPWLMVAGAVFEQLCRRSERRRVDRLVEMIIFSGWV